MTSPFEVPPFDPGKHAPAVRFVWWSWHPNYPYWSPSCWGGKTVEEAWAKLACPSACSLIYYHNKLIREGDGALTEVADQPCQRLDVWQRIYEQRQAAGPLNA